MYILYRILYPKFFASVKGISEFAEAFIARYIDRAIKCKIFSLYQRVESLKQEREEKIKDFERSQNVDRMEDGAFEIQRKKTRRLTRVVWITVLFEIFLNYISTLIFIQGEGLLYLLVRWGLAIILTLAAMLVTDGLLTKILPEEPFRVEGFNNGKKKLINLMKKKIQE